MTGKLGGAGEELLAGFYLGEVDPGVEVGVGPGFVGGRRCRWRRERPSPGEPGKDGGREAEIPRKGARRRVETPPFV